MKKKKLIVIFVACIACLANVSAQLKINSSGVITNTNAALIFKVNSTLVGFTGSSSTENSSFGYEAMLNYSAGNYNTATGSRALLSNTSGYYNTAAGCSALYFNTSGSYNTATGVCALYQNTTGIGNTASGNGALNPNTSGSYNTGIGTDALFGNTTGSHNTAVGYNAGASNPDNLTNSTVVGAGAMATGSYQARIGSSSIVSIGGFVDWTNFSDRRAKKNIRADVPGLDFISR
ncbi:MAG: hypothetical protein LBK03_04445, partial [Bacteroidales bacterium]|nr:hypothetical protein [Bacteroidales bacterium]